MKKIEFIIIGALLALSIMLFVCLMLAYNAQYGKYEYTTSSGKTGTASFCTVSYGRARCRTDDGTTIMVEGYTKK